jgi:hypothetical protein
MSTKTTFKRIALVTVAALGFGVLTSVAPASAAGPQELVSSMAVGTVPTARAGVAVNIPVVLNLPSTAAAGDTVVLGVQLLSAPATSTHASVGVNPTNATAYVGKDNKASSGTAAHLDIVAASSGSGSFGAIGAKAYSTSGNATATVQYTIGANDSTGQITLRVRYTPDVSGAYTFLVSTPSAIAQVTGLPATDGAYYSPSSAHTSAAFAVSTGTSPTTLALSNVSGNPGALAASTIPGAVIKVTLSGPLGAGESIAVTTTGSATLVSDLTQSTSSSTSLSITSCATTCYFRVDNTVGETVTVTATGNGLLSNTVTGSVGVTFTVSTATAAVTASKTGATTTTNAGLVTATASTTPTLSGAGGSAGFTYITSSGSTSQTLVGSLTATSATKVVSHWTITDTSSKILGTGVAAKYTNTTSWAAASLAAAEATKTISAALVVTDAGYQSYSALLFAAVANTTIIVTSGTPTSASLVATNPNRRVAAASTNSIVFTLTDQFDNAVSNTSVAITVAGRNGVTASSTLVTNASGEVTYSLTDAGTVGTTDTITATAPGSITGAATLTYGTTTVTTLDILGLNDSAANTPDTNITLSDRAGINATKGGATGTLVAVTVTAKDANGVVMAGVPVSFTVAGTTAAILSTKATVYTAADGTASTSVYAWATGSYVVTATAGGKTSTSTVFFAQKEPTYARTISAVVSGGTITATVKDRYGNVVPNVTVWATKTGTGFFGSGSSSTSGTTGAAGTVDFYINGSASVTLSLGSSTAADANYGQSGSAVGYVKQGDGATPALTTATTVGTAATAETGVGAAFAAAGVNSVTVAVEAGVSDAQTAADAAAEATDAANAATDAANAAAEAADAATAAAQDAADAVAALSTQVSEMVNALKKQITALTNLVIKIQKKVKA